MLLLSVTESLSKYILQPFCLLHLFIFLSSSLSLLLLHIYSFFISFFYCHLLGLWEVHISFYFYLSSSSTSVFFTSSLQFLSCQTLNLAFFIPDSDHLLQHVCPLHSFIFFTSSSYYSTSHQSKLIC